MTLQKLSTVLAVTWGLSGSFSLPFGSQLQLDIPIAQSSSANDSDPPPPGRMEPSGAQVIAPSFPPPRDNQTRPGGSLSPDRPACQSAEGTLRALIREKNPVSTISAHPTLLFYVPDVSEDVQYGEFSIYSRDDRTQFGKVRFKLPQTPGIVSVRLPERPDHALPAGETGRYYHWYLNLYCQEVDGVSVVLSVDGWIGRVASRPEWEVLVDEASPRIWYDSLAKVAEQLRASPADPVLKAKWAELLRTIEAEALSDVPLLGPAIAIPSE